MSLTSLLRLLHDCGNVTQSTSAWLSPSEGVSSRAHSRTAVLHYAFTLSARLMPACNAAGWGVAGAGAEAACALVEVVAEEPHALWLTLTLSWTPSWQSDKAACFDRQRFTDRSCCSWARPRRMLHAGLLLAESRQRCI